MMLRRTDIADQSGKVEGPAAIAAVSARTKARSAFFRPVIDATGAFAILCMICLSVGAGLSSASPNITSPSVYQATLTPTAMKAPGSQDVRPVVEIATTSSAANADAVYHRTSAQAAWALLMTGLSITAALNMAFFRHLRKAYASPRRRGS